MKKCECAAIHPELPILWYERPDGARYTTIPENPSGVPKEFEYQRSRFPCQITDNVLGVVGNKSTPVASGTTTWSSRQDLVMAMVRPSIREMINQLKRFKALAQRMTLDQAILHVTTACEGCINVLYYNYGLQDGYASGSEAHQNARTNCEICKPVLTEACSNPDHPEFGNHLSECSLGECAVRYVQES